MIRPALTRDAHQIAAIYNHYIHNTSVTFEALPVSAKEMENRVVTGEKSGTWLVSEVDGDVVGYAYSSPWGTRVGYQKSVETSVYLDHNHTGKGLGVEIYSDLLGRLRTQNMHTAIGVIGLPNPGSVSLHEKLGFVKTGELQEIGEKFNKWVDVGYWQLLL